MRFGLYGGRRQFSFEMAQNTHVKPRIEFKKTPETDIQRFGFRGAARLVLRRRRGPSEFDTRNVPANTRRHTTHRVVQGTGATRTTVGVVPPPPSPPPAHPRDSKNSVLQNGSCTVVRPPPVSVRSAVVIAAWSPVAHKKYKTQVKYAPDDDANPSSSF